MYIISLTYKVSLETIDSYLDAHIEYLNEQYNLENFQASGRKIPRTGGIILSKISNKKELLKILYDLRIKISHIIAFFFYYIFFIK
ncbi:YciI family protein [Aquimarina muelleri]|uniref:GTP cyclohydrolase n=1 Tax=Aquimarina muelleri TaxID=279356 RepID=A0A918JWI6_9FLAO|nr:hypothetical protein [Aquimarina muelleri]MCX2764633.1 GTP cyclohydrolase [Aquimarina muelleri]GGX25276.1 hypothetical protein GCM10007384_27920 [Aquimarina muelleri]